MLNLMIDIETLATTPDAAIIEIGMASFCGNHNFSRKISIFSNLEAERNCDQETINWWSSQPYGTKVDLFTNATDTLFDSITALCYKIEEMRNRNPDINFWANGITFDFTILENTLRFFKLAIPWKYYELRDYRTLKNLFPQILPLDNPVEHRALQDARCQAEHAQRILDFIQSSRGTECEPTKEVGNS